MRKLLSNHGDSPPLLSQLQMFDSIPPAKSFVCEVIGQTRDPSPSQRSFPKGEKVREGPGPPCDQNVQDACPVD